MQRGTAMQDREELSGAEFLQNAIDRETGAGDAPAFSEREALPGYAVNRTSRKKFVIKDFDTPRDKEMAVFTHAKKLSEYVFVICERSPKKLRWSIVARLQNASVEVIENLYHANYERDAEERLKYQKAAAVSLNLLDFYAQTAKTKQAINMRQTAILARGICECKKLLTGWMKSTRAGRQ